MVEKNILAYFKSPEEADEVSKKLQALRVVDMSIDRFSAFPGGEYDRYTHGVKSTSEVQSATSTAISGLSDERIDETTGFDILLTVVIEDESFDQAKRIIEEAGGRV